MIVFYIGFFFFVCLIIAYYIKQRKVNIAYFCRVIESKDAEKIKKLLNKKIDLNERCLYKHNNVIIERSVPLFVALYHNIDISLIKLFLEKGADINIKDEANNTPMLYAALYYKNPEIFDLFINAGAKTDVTNIIGANIVMIAVYNDNKSILENVLKLCSDVNHKNKGGWTALMSVALDKRPCEYAKMLIDKGADKTLKNSVGKTALDIAKENNYQELYPFLE